MLKNMHLNHYFVIFGQPYDYFRFAYRDLTGNKNGEYCYKPIKSNSGFLNRIFSAHTSEKVNSRIRLPFKRVWFKKMSYFKTTNTPYCFIFYFGTRWFNAIKYGYLLYLKKKYPNSVFVFYYGDLVSTHEDEYSVEIIKKEFDLVMSFDLGDCEKYGLIYQPLVYSTIEKTSDSVPANDVYFVGRAKDRLESIVDAYVELKNKGLKCDFHIVGAKTDERILEDEIDYCGQMPYEENIKHIKNCKAILEIMQKNGRGFTLRCCEAIAFGKILITNNEEIINTPFYNPERVLLFDEKTSFDISPIRNSDGFVNYNYSDLSPLKMFEKIEVLLNERKQ